MYSLIGVNGGTINSSLLFVFAINKFCFHSVYLISYDGIHWFGFISFSNAVLILLLAFSLVGICGRR